MREKGGGLFLVFKERAAIVRESGVLRIAMCINRTFGLCVEVFGLRVFLVTVCEKVVCGINAGLVIARDCFITL